MVQEIATITILPEKRAEFLAGVKTAVPLFQRAKGFVDLQLHSVVEEPNTYKLFVHWQTLENHMKDFRESADFQEWRRLVSHCFAQPTSVIHTEGQISS